MTRYINFMLVVVLMAGCTGTATPPESMSEFDGMAWDRTSASEFFQQPPGDAKDWTEPVAVDGMEGFMASDFTWDGKIKGVIQAYFVTDSPDLEMKKENYNHFFLNAIVIVSEADKLNRMFSILKKKYGKPAETREKNGQDLYIWRSEKHQRMITLRKTAITAKAWFIPFDLFDKVPL